jgi:hypothetical protein
VNFDFKIRSKSKDIFSVSDVLLFYATQFLYFPIRFRVLFLKKIIVLVFTLF